MGFRIAVDTGGTFSDVVVTNDETGELWINKASTTPARIFEGISEALTVEAAQHGLTLAELLAQTTLFVYGTTRATNAILTGGTAKTAFLTSARHPDTLVLREGGKLNPFDFRHAYPEPYIPKRLTYEIDERIDSEGHILVPLDDAQVVELAAHLRAEDVHAVAVCLLWSIVNPRHEKRIGEIMKSELPDVPVTLSHELNPIIREYRRASSAAIDASLKPLMQGHLREMASDLREAGFVGELLVGTSFGGVLTAEEVAERPIYTVNSAPAMAPVAGRAYAGSDESGVIVCDMGGTSFDVSLIRDGYIKFTRETWLGEQFTGHMTGLSAVDVKNIGAGGGSIAWIDPGGLLRVGPESAGAVPGPACYGQGGEKPTVSDAAVVLGYIDPDYFLGGRIRLSFEAARDAIERDVAGPLGMEVEAAAHAILTLANEHMVNAIRDITINEGIDPRESLIVAGGGASGMAIGRIADMLGCDRVLVPRTAGTLSACGGLFSDIVSEFSASQRADTNRFDREAINATLAGLEGEMEKFFGRLGTSAADREREYFVEARYPYQAWELEVPLASGRFVEEADVQALVDGFHVAHDRVFGVAEPGQHVECIYWKARAEARLPKPELTPVSVQNGGVEAERSTLAWFGGEAPEETVRHHGAALTPGTLIKGPSVIQEPTTTVVVYPGWTAEVTQSGEYLMERTKDERPVTTSADTTSETTTDSVLLAVLANRLESVVREMTNTLLRAGRSAVLNTARDFSCSLITSENELLASAEGLPVHVIGTELLAEAMTELHPEFREGDAYLHNDPYLGNTHAADHAILVPVFFEGEHVFTACAKAHQADCGNTLPTTYMPGARDVYEEGALIFPCVAVQRDYVDIDDVIRMCRRRIRVPEQWYGDYLATLGAARIAERRLKELCAKYGLQTVRAFIRDWFDYSERRMIQAIRELPSGEVVGNATHDPYVGVPEGVPLRATIGIDGEQAMIDIDLRDNPDNYPGGLNESKACATNNVITGVFNSIDPDVPHNAGSFRRVNVHLREGCVAGIPKFPHSCSMATTNIADRLVCLTQAAFADLSDGLGLAEGGLGMGISYGVISGRDGRYGGAPYVNQIFLGSTGGPGGPVADGWPTYYLPVAASLMYHDSTEIDEQKYPLHVCEKYLVRDSAGAGRRRGGLGSKVVYTCKNEPMTVAYTVDGNQNPPRGVRGGKDGQPADAWGLEDSGERRTLPMATTLEIQPGERLVSVTSGGGGYGDPLTREPELVAHDVTEGWVSESDARHVYGVLLRRAEGDREARVVDGDATRELRARQSAAGTRECAGSAEESRRPQPELTRLRARLV